MSKSNFPQSTNPKAQNDAASSKIGQAPTPAKKPDALKPTAQDKNQDANANQKPSAFKQAASGVQSDNENAGSASQAEKAKAAKK